MLYIKRLCLDNKIHYKEICGLLNVSHSTYMCILNNSGPFKLEYLIKIKEYFVSKNILTEDFDVGDFLNDVD